MTQTGRPEVRASPETGREWASLLRSGIASRPSDALSARAELGLPTDRPIIMTGHQCAVWHAGIAAKFVAADLFAAAHSGAAAWLWVDQDTDDSAAIRVPVRSSDGRLAVNIWALKPAPPHDHAAASRPAFAPAPFAGRPALDSVSRGLSAISKALSAQSTASNTAVQVAGAVGTLLTQFVRPGVALFATALLRTTLGREILAAMSRDPLRVVSSYNRAAAAKPEAGIAPLRIDEAEDRIELPLWRIRPDLPRARVFADELPTINPAELAPRALLLTGIVRVAACDLFIHGTGGGVYDTITEEWFLAAFERTLAPTVTITADVLLPLGAPETSEASVARAAWTLHNARHNPDAIGDSTAAAAKAAAIADLARRRRANEPQQASYLAMHSALSEYRTRNRDRLDALERALESRRAELLELPIARDRTWAFPFHSHESLVALRDAVARALEAT